MNEIKSLFFQALKNESKVDLVNIMKKINQLHLEPLFFYNHFIIPALKEEFTLRTNIEYDQIFQEHVRTNLVIVALDLFLDTIVEKYEQQIKKMDVAVVCPALEQHDIGARVVGDYLLSLGYNVVNVGANTPLESVIYGLRTENIKVVLISVTNYFNLVETNRLISNLRSNLSSEVKIYVGGSAFTNNTTIIEQLDIDGFIENLEDIESFL